MTGMVGMTAVVGSGLPLTISHNTLVVSCGVAAVGFAAGVIGCWASGVRGCCLASRACVG